MYSDRSTRSMRAQRGVATLMVVMALFFIVSLVAAYASRNLIFEQRTSANQYRSTQAFEAAEAGVEWGLALLNAGRIDAACAPTTNTAFDDFRNRHYTVDPVIGTFVKKQWLDAGVPKDLRPTCVSSGVGWTCSCPNNGNPVVTVPAGPGTFPAFSVQFDSGPVPGSITIRSTGCTSAENNCLETGFSLVGDAGARVLVQAALARAMPTSPAAAATVRNNLNVGAFAWQVANADPGTNGFTVHAGGTVTAPNAIFETVPGAPGGNTVLENDPTLAALSADQMFSSYFGVDRNTFKRQPTTVVLTCGGGCGNALRDAVLTNPGRPIWVEGDLTIDTGVNIGSAAQPALIMATGNINITAPTARIFGIVYSQAANWVSNGSGSIQGALLAEGNFDGSASAPALIFDADIVNQIRMTYGPTIRVPGGWNN